MLALLLAPRGRISAARMAARAREQREAGAPRPVVRPPEAPAAGPAGSPVAEMNDAHPQE